MFNSIEFSIEYAASMAYMEIEKKTGIEGSYSCPGYLITEAAIASARGLWCHKSWLRRHPEAKNLFISMFDDEVFCLAEQN